MDKSHTMAVKVEARYVYAKKIGHAAHCVNTCPPKMDAGAFSLPTEEFFSTNVKMWYFMKKSSHLMENHY